jgi:hypothetical protein
VSLQAWTTCLQKFEHVRAPLHLLACQRLLSLWVGIPAELVFDNGHRGAAHLLCVLCEIRNRQTHPRSRQAGRTASIQAHKIGCAMRYTDGLDASMSRVHQRAVHRLWFEHGSAPPVIRSVPVRNRLGKAAARKRRTGVTVLRWASYRKLFFCSAVI